MTGSRRLAGHGLFWGGKADHPTGRAYCGLGPALCECGERSPDLPTNNARKEWHRGHKAEKLAELGARV